MRVDEGSILRQRHRVDGEIAPHQVLLQRHRGSVEHEALVARRRLALGSRQRVLLMGLRVEKDRKILAHRRESERQHLFRCRADHVVAILTSRPSNASRTAPPTV